MLSAGQGAPGIGHIWNYLFEGSVTQQNKATKRQSCFCSQACRHKYKTGAFQPKSPLPLKSK